MLEAPEARLLAAQIEKDLKGKKVEAVLAGFTPHKFAFFNKPKGEFEALFEGRELTGARSVGGMLEIMFGNLSLALTDGANITYTAPPADLPKTHQLLIGFTDQSCITVAVRMYAGIICFMDGKPEGQLADYYRTAISKPQVMSPDFTRGYFLSLAGAPGLQKKSAKALLATEQRIPGLGNGVLQDILYNAAIHPKRKVADISAMEMDKLYDSVTGTLDRMFAEGGRDSETDLYGNRGGYVASLSKETAGKPCRRCGSVIIKENYMGGSVYFCPGCQPL